MNIFSYDSKFSQFLLRVSFSCWLNVLWTLCCLPVFTIGASTTALYSMTLRIAAEREHNITRDFFRAFRDNFLQSTRIWIGMLLAGIVLIADGIIVYRLRAASVGLPAVAWTLNLALLIVAGIVYTVILMYVFPLIARFENTDLNMIKNSLLIGLRYLFCTISIFAIHFAMFYLVVAVFTPLVIFGEGLCALLSSYLLINVFRAVSAEEEPE